MALPDPPQQVDLTTADSKVSQPWLDWFRQLKNASVTPPTPSGSYDLGTITSGTLTLDVSLGELQYLTNGGAFTLAAPTTDGLIWLLITNNASAGVITFSGFTIGCSAGDALDTEDGHQFLVEIVRINGVTTYEVDALQCSDGWDADEETPADMAVSADTLTATGSGTGAVGFYNPSVRSVTGHGAGEFYVEFNCTDANAGINNNVFVGFAGGDWTPANFLVNAPNVIYSLGGFGSFGSFTPISYAFSDQGSLVHYAATAISGDTDQNGGYGVNMPTNPGIVRGHLSIARGMMWFGYAPGTPGTDADGWFGDPVGGTDPAFTFPVGLFMYLGTTLYQEAAVDSLATLCLTPASLTYSAPAVSGTKSWDGTTLVP